jgi:hypothetical protein
MESVTPPEPAEAGLAAGAKTVKLELNPYTNQEQSQIIEKNI